MNPKVEFHFDFGSPNAYLAAQVIPAIEKRTGVKFDYVPVLLGGIYKLTGNSSPADYLRGIKNKPEHMRARDGALSPPAQHHDIQVEPVLPCHHADADARGDRRAVRRCL